MDIILANPRGFCAGVNMAIDALDLAVGHFGPGIYVYHEIVHNRYVVERFTRQGVTFVDEVDEVPAGSVLLYSAHGVSPEVRDAARARNLHTIDATCPLVTKVHVEAVRYARDGYHIVLIGHEGHDEVIGTMGEAPESITLVDSPEEVDRLSFPADAKIAVLTQTTLSVDEADRVMTRLRQRFPDLETPRKEDICYATTNRQLAVRELAARADLLIVLGSQNSSNSQRLAEIAGESDIPGYLIDGADELRDEWFHGVDTVLVTAGASAPEVVVEGVIDTLRTKYAAAVREETLTTENVRFPLPKELRTLEVGGVSGPDADLGSPELLALVERMRTHGRAVRFIDFGCGSDEDRFLTRFGALGNAGGSMNRHVLLRPHVSTAVALEEFLHGTQARLGLIERLGVDGCEAHVKEFMIRHRRLLGLTDREVAILDQLLEQGL